MPLNDIQNNNRNDFVHLGAFDIPRELKMLIKQGIWPQAGSNANTQESNPIVSTKITKLVWPNEDKVILMPPPFHTIEDEVKDGNKFWTEFLTNAGEIDYSKALIIADFGLGSDSPIVLYYDRLAPSVMYLKWSGGGTVPIKHSWILSHKSFTEFANELRLV